MIFVLDTVLMVAVTVLCQSLSLLSSIAKTMKMPCDSVSLLGGDADTMGAIAGAIAGDYYHRYLLLYMNLA